MSNLQFQNIYKSIPFIWLLSILGVSLASALFMPAMFTFYFGFPALILAVISIKSKSFVTFFSLLGGIVFISVITIGLLYLLPFFFFIHLFPTYVVILITLLIMRLIPYNLSNISVILIFLLLSTLIGLNSKIVPLLSAMVKPQYTVQEQINEVLQITEDDSIQMIGNAQSFPDKYLTNDFISFGSNEGCMCGYWVYPRIGTSSVPKLLQDREIAYTLLNESPKKIDIQYKETNNFYTLTIKVKESDKTLSSLSISDRLPYRSDISTRELDSFEPRLEYLLRHNIWNGLIYYAWDELLHFSKIKKSNEMLISDFLKRSIYSPDKQINGYENIIELDSKLLFESELKECSLLKSDDYKNYPFNEWKEAYADKSVKTVPDDSYIVEYNNTFYATKVRTDGKSWWHNHNFSYSNDKFIYAFKNFNRDYIQIIQFTKKGKFIKELHINMPDKKDNVVNLSFLQNFNKSSKKMVVNINDEKNNLVARNWHPISHVLTTDKEIKFRVYSIYERSNQQNLCKYQYLEVPLN